MKPSLLIGLVVGTIFLSSRTPSSAAVLTNSVTGILIYDGSSPMGNWHGTNTAITGFVTCDNAGKILIADIRADVSKWNSGNAIRDGHCREMFGATQFPVSRFILTEVKSGDGAGKVILTGQLEMHGIKRDLEIPGTLTLEQNHPVFTGTFTTRLTDWGMKRPSMLGMVVADEVKIHIQSKGIAP